MLSDQDRDRYFVSAGDIIPGGSTTWYIVDWDQRRTYAVVIDYYRFDEELAVEYLHRHVNALEPDVCAICIRSDGEVLRTSSDPADDKTRSVEYIPLGQYQLPPGIQKISLSHLERKSRLGANVDRVTHHDSKSVNRMLVCLARGIRHVETACSNHGPTCLQILLSGPVPGPPMG